MKTRTFVSILILILAVLIIAGSCATDKMTYVSKEYEIFGTWVNLDYNNSSWAPKEVYYPDGRIHTYSSDTGSDVISEDEFVITSRWIDTNGDIWYTMRTRFGAFKLLWWYRLCKISDLGKTVEFNSSQDNYPNELNPNGGLYRIYYRQE